MDTVTPPAAGAVSGLEDRRTTELHERAIETMSRRACERPAQVEVDIRTLRNCIATEVSVGSAIMSHVRSAPQAGLSCEQQRVLRRAQAVLCADRSS